MEDFFKSVETTDDALELQHLNCNSNLVTVVGKQLNSSPGQAPDITRVIFERTGSLQTKLNPGLSEQQQDNLFKKLT